MAANWKSYLIIILVLIFINLIDFPAYSGEVRGVTDTTIKVGIIGDLTGPIATTWQPALRSIRTCLRHINESGGIHRRKIVNVVEDDRYSIPMALAAFKKIVFRDQVLQLAQLKTDLMMRGELKSMSSMVREAIDEYLKKHQTRSDRTPRTERT